MGADTHLEQGMIERKNVHDGAHVMLSLAGWTRVKYTARLTHLVPFNQL